MNIIMPNAVQMQTRAVLMIRHGDQEIPWNVKAFAKAKGGVGEEADPLLFKCINDFLDTLPPEDQAQVFHHYSRMRHIFDTATNHEIASYQLAQVIRDLFEIVTFDKVASWVHFFSGIRIPGPPDLPLVFEEDGDKSHTREKTYTVEDYRKLVTLIVQLRLMVPIWGEFIKMTGGDAGNNFKEYDAYFLLALSSVWHNPGMTKVRTYVEEYVPEEGNQSAIANMVSSEDYPLWIFGLLVVRKLSLMNVIMAPDDHSPIIVKHISRHVRERVRRTENAFGGRIHPKKPEKTNVSEENSSSALESNKVQEEHKRAAIEYLKYQLRDPYRVAYRLDPTCPKELVEKFLRTTPDVHDAQIVLFKWMIDPVIPAQGVDYLSRLEVHTGMCACAAVMWHNGHEFMAGLLTATAIKANQGEMLSSGTESRGRMGEELQQRLNEQFPYKRKKGTKTTNPVFQDIDKMVNMFSKRAWNLTLPPEMVSVINPRSATTRVSVPHTFKAKFAELVLYLAVRPYHDVMPELAY